ncbi:MAG TPA: sigma-70 family RNA polymerase sigma factor, partial [Nakamurella sp.]
MPDQEADQHVVSDPELITKVRTGDREAFGELYRRHSGPATSLSRQFARSAAESDDLVSESFARVLDNLLAGKGPDTAFRAYLFTTIRNTAYDRTRKDKRLHFTDDMTTHDTAVVGDDPVLAKMESGLVATAFAQLPERWQAVLWHTQVEGETPAQVGALLGMAPGAVSSLAFRAREGLREAYLQAHLAETAAERCRSTVERLGAWTRGGLSKREKAQVDAHLKECDRCRALAAELAEVNEGLRGVLAPLLLGGAAVGYLATLGPVAPLAAPGTLIAGTGIAASGTGGAGGGTVGGAAGGAGAASGAGAGGVGAAGASA